MDAFDKRCNPKKNETVVRYEFLSRFQNPGESLEKLIDDLNFADLKDSLVRDRIICRIQEKQLREGLIMDPCLDLQRYLEAFKAAEFSKERSKTLKEGETVNALTDQMKRGKGFHNKRREKVEETRESFKRREKSENDRQ